ncbi:MAG: class I SAM-dependent methyltransferase, partial [Deltaproteobacteria bacterium]|nr:class I SAM-dependent methyltransferase [Deltaproteobacteria bacterium]
MLVKAEHNAARWGVGFNGLVQEISKLDVPADSFDLVWLSASMYSTVPTSKRRIDMLRRIGNALGSGGYLVCQFHWDETHQNSPLAESFRKAIAFLTSGYFDYEQGDQLWGNVEFIHSFSDPNRLKAEFESGGFELIHIHISKKNLSGGAVLKPRTFSRQPI